MALLASWLRPVKRICPRGGEVGLILSKANRFIFIKGVKVGGTSVEIALSTICGPDDIVTPITPIDELKRVAAGGGARNYSTDSLGEITYLETLQRTAPADLAKCTFAVTPYFNHMTLREVLELQGPAAFDYQVLCVERNPYAKIFSWTNHQLSFAAYQTGGEMRADWQDFKSYLVHAVNNHTILAVKNIERYCGPDGTITAHVMRLENLAADFRQFVGSLGIDYRSALPHAKKGISANRLDPQDLLDRRQIRLINDLFCEEFETFGYKPL